MNKCFHTTNKQSNSTVNLSLVDMQSSVRVITHILDIFCTELLKLVWQI